MLAQVSGDHTEVVKLIPPFIIGEPEVDRFVDAFVDVMDEAHSGGGLIWDIGRTLVKTAGRVLTSAGRSPISGRHVRPDVSQYRRD
jgi:hypothetical protein